MTCYMRFDFVGLTILLSAVFNAGTGGAVPVVAHEKTGSSPGVTAIPMIWQLGSKKNVICNRYRPEARSYVIYSPCALPSGNAQGE